MHTGWIALCTSVWLTLLMAFLSFFLLMVQLYVGRQHQPWLARLSAPQPPFPSILFGPHRSRPSSVLLGIVYEDPDPAMAAAFASATLFDSPILPFCCGILPSARSPPQAPVGQRSPSTLRTSGPSRPVARPRASSPPSSSGARRGPRRPGSGCSCVGASRWLAGSCLRR